MRNMFNANDDKFVNKVSPSAGREKMIATLEKCRIAYFCVSMFQFICVVLLVFLGSGSSLLTGLCAMCFLIVSISTDNQIKWLKSVKHQQELDEKNRK